MGDEPSMTKLPNDVYRFAVQWCGERAILQVDFVSRSFTLLQRGCVKYTCNFREYKDFIIDSHCDRLCVQFLYRSLTVFIDDNADKEILDYLLKVIKTIILNKRTNKTNFTGIVCQIFSGSRPLRILPQTILKEGVVIKKGNGMLPRWEKRHLQIRLGEITYFRIGDTHPLNVARVWEEECFLGVIDKNGFSITVKATSRIYYFKVQEENKTEDEILSERWEWMESLKKGLVSKYSVINAPRNLYQRENLQRFRLNCSAKRQVPVQRQLTCQPSIQGKEDGRGLNTL